MYYTKTYEQDPKKTEMSFDCTNYQHQFRRDHEAEILPMPFDRHVFQTIFLDKENKHLGQSMRLMGAGSLRESGGISWDIDGNTMRGLSHA
jgi:hypothetical protein